MSLVYLAQRRNDRNVRPYHEIPPSHAFTFSRFHSLALSLSHYLVRMHWVFLLLASLFEIGFAFSLGQLKHAKGAPYIWWFAGFAVCLVLSIYLLYKATDGIALGTAYAIWTGIGAVGIAMLGIFVFKEPATFWRVFFMTTLIASIIGLKLVSPEH
jgi:quaternary ammonium compound-resistance protein SugE